MEKTVHQLKHRFQAFHLESRYFFQTLAPTLAASNWRLIRPMSLIYLAYLLIYRLAVCPIYQIRLQNLALACALAVHAALMAWIFHFGKRIPAPRTCHLTISVFATEILFLAGFIDLIVFPGQISFIFPLILVLVTQIYTRPFSYPLSEIGISSVLYLLGSLLLQTTDIFLFDLVSISIALGIAGCALVGISRYRLDSFRAQNNLKKMCALDSMTKVNTKETFRYLAEERLRTHSSMESTALAICDLDNFKHVNDQYGHRQGDAVLLSFSEKLRLLEQNCPNAIVGRFGGDEFVVLLSGYASRQEVLSLLKSLCRTDTFPFPVTCSIGVVFAPGSETGFDALFDQADQNLYSVKEKGDGLLCATDFSAGRAVL